jgi:DNA replication protein DnaC
MKRPSKVKSTARKRKSRKTATKHEMNEATGNSPNSIIVQPEPVVVEGFKGPLNRTAAVKLKKEEREQFRDSHKAILDQIVSGAAPKVQIDITKEIKVGKIALGDYVTLDWQHYEEIKRVIRTIREYTKDSTKKRPHNIILQAEPGSGKSHFIKSLAKRLAPDGISEVTFNMSSLQGVDDLIQPIEAVRNIKVVDKIPLLFLDEFDSHQDNYSLLLPLLWDGEVNVGQRWLRIGKVVTVLAGSGKEISDAMKAAKGMQPEVSTEAGKLPDLLSRINGGELTIPGLDEVGRERDRRVDKICLTVSLILQRFPNLQVAPWGFLRFVSETHFRYGVRSISHLIDLIPSIEDKKIALEMKDLRLPLTDVETLKASSLAYHLIAEDGPASIIESWKALQASDVSVRFAEAFKFLTFSDLVEKFISR